MPFRFCACLTVVCVAVSLIAPPRIAAAELAAATTQAYDRYIATLLGEFSKRIASDMFLEHGIPPALDRMRRGEVLLDAGSGDGIIDVPNGLIHHWRATVFIPNVTLAGLLKTVQDYPGYASLYTWLVASELLNVDGDRYRTFFRAKRSAGVVTGVLDLWMTTEYQRLATDRVTSIAKAECVRQVEHAGERGEHRLRPGSGSGYLWRVCGVGRDRPEPGVPTPSRVGHRTGRSKAGTRECGEFVGYASQGHHLPTGHPGETKPRQWQPNLVRGVTRRMAQDEVRLPSRVAVARRTPFLAAPLTLAAGLLVAVAFERVYDVRIRARAPDPRFGTGSGPRRPFASRS
jgi:hypothetical protein